MPSAPQKAVTRIMIGFCSFIQITPATIPRIKLIMPAITFESEGTNETRRPHEKTETRIKTTKNVDKRSSLVAKKPSIRPRISALKRIIHNSSVKWPDRKNPKKAPVTKPMPAVKQVNRR